MGASICCQADTSRSTVKDVSFPSSITSNNPPRDSLWNNMTGHHLRARTRVNRKNCRAKHCTLISAVLIRALLPEQIAGKAL